MCSAVPLGPLIGPLLFLFFVNDLPSALKASTPLFADSVQMLTRRAHKISLHSSLIVAWDVLIKPAMCNNFTIMLEVPIRLSFFLRWVWHPHLYVSNQIKLRLLVY